MGGGTRFGEVQFNRGCAIIAACCAKARLKSLLATIPPGRAGVGSAVVPQVREGPAPGSPPWTSPESSVARSPQLFRRARGVGFGNRGVGVLGGGLWGCWRRG